MDLFYMIYFVSIFILEVAIWSYWRITDQLIFVKIIFYSQLLVQTLQVFIFY